MFPKSNYFLGKSKKFKKSNVVSVINFIGIISPNMGRRKGLNIHDYNKLIEQAFHNKRTKAVVLVINSPGGSPVQSEFLADRIISLSKEKNYTSNNFCRRCSCIWWVLACMCGR